jgi:hypothetical protein
MISAGVANRRDARDRSARRRREREAAVGATVPRRPRHDSRCRGQRSTLLRQSLPLFLQDSELDEWETHGQEVVWIGSTLEQMCDVSGRNKNTQMATTITNALSAAWDAPRSAPSIAG